MTKEKRDIVKDMREGEIRYVRRRNNRRKENDIQVREENDKKVCEVTFENREAGKKSAR